MFLKARTALVSWKSWVFEFWYKQIWCTLF